MPLLTLLGQSAGGPATHTLGGTSQLSGFGSSGGLNVVTPAGPGSPPVTGNEGGARAWSDQAARRKRRQRIMDDDAEFMEMAQQALPEMMKYWNKAS